MDQILYQYSINATTWVYLSSLLTIAIYFKFSRLWSVRNFDLLGLIALAPGLLLVEHGGSVEHWGYIWLFAAGALFLIRLLIDPMMVRRPLLEPNLSLGGLTFTVVSLFVFLMVNVITKDPYNPDDAELGQARVAANTPTAEGTSQTTSASTHSNGGEAQKPNDTVPDDQTAATTTEQPPSWTDETSLSRYGPGYHWLHVLAGMPAKALVKPDAQLPEEVRRLMIQKAIARTLAIISHLAVVMGMIFIGVWHFDNVRTGIAAAALYLLLPYTAQMTGRVDHVLPAALLVWAVAFYRSPLISGMLVGLVTGAIYYPVFLLPLWCSFYSQRGLWRFLVGVASMLLLLVATLAFTADGSLDRFLYLVSKMFGWTSLVPASFQGFWSIDQSAIPYRIPVFVAFLVLCFSFILWPAQKNLGALLCCTAAVMLGTQFWHSQEGGMYVGWYLPLLLLTIFRPNLEDRVALSSLGEGWLSRRFTSLRFNLRGNKPQTKAA